MKKRLLFAKEGNMKKVLRFLVLLLVIAFAVPAFTATSNSPKKNHSGYLGESGKAWYKVYADYLYLTGGTAYKFLFTGKPSADRTYTLPDRSGTIAMTSDVSMANVTITGGNVTGLTSLGAANLTVTGTAVVTGASFTGLTVDSVTGAAATADLAKDNSTASHYLYKDSSGNITNATVGAGLSDDTGTLSVKQVVNTVFADTDVAVTVGASKKGYVVPSLYNGSTVSSMTCAVYDTNSASANSTVINLIKASGGVLTDVFDTAVNIPFGSYSNTTSVYNATNAVVATGDLLIANVTAIADPAPLGLSCTFIFAH